MTRYYAVLAAAVLLAIGTGCRNQESAKTVEGVPGLAFERLTEDDVVRFCQALPSVVAYLEDETPSREPVKPTAGMAAVYTRNVEWVKDVPGVDSMLSANGLDWPFLRAMLWRLQMIAIVVGLEDVETQARSSMLQAPADMRKLMKQRLKEMKTIAEHVPKENVEVFQRHYREIRPFFQVVER
jgi:hypothetical protein